MSGPRNSGGEILALAKTETGVTSVFWEPLSKTWVLSDNSWERSSAALHLITIIREK